MNPEVRDIYVYLLRDRMPIGPIVGYCCYGWAGTFRITIADLAVGRGAGSYKSLEEIPGWNEHEQ